MWYLCFIVFKNLELFSIVAVATSLPQNKVGGLGFRHCFPFPRSLCVECLVMATVTGTRKYLAALLISSPSNECYGIYVKHVLFKKPNRRERKNCVSQIYIDLWKLVIPPSALF